MKHTIAPIPTGKANKAPAATSTANRKNRQDIAAAPTSPPPIPEQQPQALVP